MRLQTKQAQQVMQNEAWGSNLRCDTFIFAPSGISYFLCGNIQMATMTWIFGIARLLVHSILQSWTTKILTISMECRTGSERSKTKISMWASSVMWQTTMERKKDKRKRHIFPESVILELMMEQEQQCFPTETWTRFQPGAPWRWEPASLWQDIWSLSMATRGSVSPP